MKNKVVNMATGKVYVYRRVDVIMDPELYHALEYAAECRQITRCSLIREALREFLGVGQKRKK